MIDLMRSYNAERRLRKGFIAVVAAKRFIKGGIKYRETQSASSMGAQMVSMAIKETKDHSKADLKTLKPGAKVVDKSVMN